MNRCHCSELLLIVSTAHDEINLPANHSSGQTTSIKIFKFLVRVLRPFHLNAASKISNSIEKRIQISSPGERSPAWTSPVKVTETRYVLRCYATEERNERYENLNTVEKALIFLTEE